MSTQAGYAAAGPSPSRLPVEIWSDLVCPWCYLGRARFELALEAFAQRDSVDVSYRSFELDPNAPQGRTTTVAEMLATKYGGRAEAIQAAEQRLVEMTGELGLGYRVDRLHGNTLDAPPRPARHRARRRRRPRRSPLPGELCRGPVDLRSGLAHQHCHRGWAGSRRDAPGD